MLHRSLSFLCRAVLALCLLAAIPAWAADLTGRIVAIQDGGIPTLLTPEQRQIRVRLHAIDTPESR